ncbi:MAG: hypothetical protein WD557_15170 [Dehalococcoidia bacterium]
MESPRRWNGPVEKPFEPAPRPKGPRGMAATFLSTLRETFVPAFPDPIRSASERADAGSPRPDTMSEGR